MNIINIMSDRSGVVNAITAKPASSVNRSNKTPMKTLCRMKYMAYLLALLFVPVAAWGQTADAPAITIMADRTTVVEGQEVTFTLTANPPPAMSLTQSVTLRLSRTGFDLDNVDTEMVTVGTSGTGMFTYTVDSDNHC